MRRIKVEFAGREFSLLSDEPDEIVEKVREDLQRILKDHEKYVGSFPLEEIIFLALANSVLEKVKLEKRVEEVIGKIREWSDEGRNV